MKARSINYQSQFQRDVEAMYQYLVRENQRRIDRDLPPFEPSYELAEEAVTNIAEGKQA